LTPPARQGLTNQIEKVLPSPNERLVAALGHDSRVAVWDLQSEELLHVFEAPKPLWVGNAALAFSPDSRRLAFAGSSTTAGRAMLWDLGTGQELARAASGSYDRSFDDVSVTTG
jgi:WD40 repeat protein